MIALNLRALTVNLSVCALALLMAPEAKAVEVEKVVSPGGIEAWLIQDDTNPMLTMDLGFRGGARLDPIGKEGLASFVAATLDEGAGDLDSQAFQGRLDDLAISLSFSADRDLFAGSLKTLTQNRDEAFDMMRLALTKPRFDKDAVERLRRQLISRVEQSATKPRTIARKALSQKLFPDHPYGRERDGSPESLAAITRDDLQGYVSAFINRDNLMIGVVGDITSEELKPLLDKTFGALPKTGTPVQEKDVSVVASGRTVVIDKVIPQSVIVFAQPGLKRDDPDYYAATAMNYILGGGGFVSRLYEEIREKRGLVYSVSSFLMPRDEAGLVFGAAATENARAAETARLIRQEWEKMAENGVTAAELDAAKTYLTGSFPLRFSSSERISGMLLGMQLAELGIDYFDKRRIYIEAVTLDQVNGLAKRLLNSDQLTMVVVGQPEGLTTTQ